jgi:hypothetical protein
VIAMAAKATDRHMSDNRGIGFAPWSTRINRRSGRACPAAEDKHLRELEENQAWVNAAGGAPPETKIPRSGHLAETLQV